MRIRSGAAGQAPYLTIAGALFLLMVLIAPLITVSAGPLTGEGSTQRQIGYLIILILSIVGAFREGEGWKGLMLPVPLIAALLWCWASLAWSSSPDVAVRRLLLTTITIWTVFILVQNSGYERSLLLLRIAFVVTLVANYVTVAVDPAVGIHGMPDAEMPTALTGNWRGFMAHKNFAGAATALCIILFLFDAGTIKRWMRIAIVLLAAFFLFKTQSKTSAGMLAMSLLTGFVFKHYTQRYRRFAVPIIMVLSSIGWFLYSAYGEDVQQSYLSPAAFTGRGQIWSAMLRYSADHLSLGAGFGSFWNIGTESPMFTYASGWVTRVTVGHNGYLDLLITIGVPGLLLVVFAAILWPTWRLLTSKIDIEQGALATALLLFCIGHNMTESSLFDRDAFVGVMFMIAIAFTNVARRSTASAGASGSDVFRALRARRSEGSAAAELTTP